MPYTRLDLSTQSDIEALNHADWRPDAIAQHLVNRPGIASVYRMRNNLAMYGSRYCPYQSKPGPRRSITTAARLSLLAYLEDKPWILQSEMVMFLEEEWGIETSQPSVSRMLKEHGISHKQGHRGSNEQNEALKDAWQAEMKTDFTAEMLIFLDECLFKEQTGWRLMAYAAIGDPARWQADNRRGATHSVLAAMTTDGYLPCTGIKRGFFNGDQFVDWLENRLLPHCSRYPGPRSVICLDNLSIHHDPRVDDIINRHSMLIRYLPPYTPEYSPIELSFNVLKSWMRKHFVYLKDGYQGHFEAFLEYAVKASKCDSHAVQFFRHSCEGGYKFEGDYEAYMRELRS